MADISTVIDGLAAAPDPVLPDLVREHAPPLLSSNGGLLRPLVPRLRALDGHGDPWVQLVVAFARHDADLSDAEAPELAARALSGFRQSGDRRGEGLALYTLGNQAISRGDLATAVERWEGGRRLLGPESAAYAQALCNTSLGAYAEGDLRRALAIAEHGLAVSAQGGLHRAAGTARLYMAGCMPGNGWPNIVPVETNGLTRSGRPPRAGGGWLAPPGRGRPGRRRPGTERCRRGGRRGGR